MYLSACAPNTHAEWSATLFYTAVYWAQPEPRSPAERPASLHASHRPHSTTTLVRVVVRDNKHNHFHAQGSQDEGSCARQIISKSYWYSYSYSYYYLIWY